jgi:hypothetical protein
MVLKDGLEGGDKGGGGGGGKSGARGRDKKEGEGAWFNTGTFKNSAP